MRPSPINKEFILESLKLHSNEIKAYGVHSLGLFGSFVKNTATENSDIDLLVSFAPKQKTYDNFMELSFFLENLFGRKIEMVTPQSLNKYIGSHILNEVENVGLYLELLRHILDETNFVLDTVNGKDYDEVMNNGVLFRAIVRSIEIIGEAAKKLSEDFKSRHRDIEWKKMGRTRDILIHVYFAIDNEIVWNIITDKLPPLQLYISKLIE